MTAAHVPRWDHRGNSPLRSTRASGVSVTEMVLRPSHRGTAHAHRSSYLSLVLHGDYGGYYDERRREAVSGETFFYEGGVQHRGDVGDRPTRVVYVELPPGALRSREREALRKLAISPARRAGATSLALRRLYVSFAAGAQAPTIASCLRNLVTTADRESEVAPHAPEWIEHAQAIVSRDITTTLSLTRVAGELDLSSTNMARTFKKHVGCTLGEYQRRARITSAAAELSSSRRSLTEVAQRTGFADQSHMGRHFRHYLGVTPADYRTLARGPASSSPSA